MAKNTLFYTDKPLFGMDIGHGSLKVMQLHTADKKSTIVGYGTSEFDLKAIKDGVIVDPKAVAQATRMLFQNHLIGSIDTRRVAMAIPAYRTFSRSIQLPKLNDKELLDAVQLEVEQYVPIPLQDLFLDYTVTRQNPENNELLVVAVPKKIVESYLVLTQMMDLELILIEPTTNAAARLFSRDINSDLTSALIDFGSLTASISLYDKTILATSTVPAGGLVFTQAIRDKLQVSEKEAGLIKTKHGLGVSKYQAGVEEALEPALQKIVAETRRMLRYYEEHYSSKNTVGQIVMMGGGANMPGLADYLTNVLKMPVRTHNHPWAIFAYKDLRLPTPADRLMYATVAGLALTNPKEVFGI